MVYLLLAEFMPHELQGHGEAADVALHDTGIAQHRVSAAYRTHVSVGSGSEQTAVGDELLGLVIDALAELSHQFRAALAHLAIRIEAFYLYLIREKVLQRIGLVECCQKQPAIGGDYRLPRIRRL